MGAFRDPAGLERVIAEADHLRWVQLPFAGIEQYLHLVDDDRHVDVRQGRLRRAGGRARADARHWPACAASASTPGPQTWGKPQGTNLLGANVTILGGGGITESLLRLLQPFDCHVTVVRNRVRHMEGVDDVVEADRYIDALAGADLVVARAVADRRDRGHDRRVASSRPWSSHAWIVNVARGRHIVTDDLVVGAARTASSAAPALDVTDPEPLPDGHPLWTLPNCIITPARRQHARDGRAAAGRAHHCQRAPVRRRRRAARARPRRPGLLMRSDRSMPAAIVGLLADDDRRRVVAAIELGHDTVRRDRRAPPGCRPPVSPRRAGRLAEVGLVVQRDAALHVDGKAFQAAAAPGADPAAVRRARRRIPTRHGEVLRRSSSTDGSRRSRLRTASGWSCSTGWRRISSRGGATARRWST